MKSTISIIKRCSTVLLSLITHRYAAGNNKKTYQSSPGPGSPIFAFPFFPSLAVAGCLADTGNTERQALPQAG